ncbi:hypothetical protein [Flavicella sp.]|uniref:hypothetical protein n=1 Tax=Flavicella sp. TaxID=2957742 RepID=UPI00261C12C1|nr:hypothetical protein [Flavicella sp.]MDG1804448.1 hypothetical protein [Flavicella sp.]MDG2279373.1 hypothetical protein [Flavicella sp.]
MKFDRKELVHRSKVFLYSLIDIEYEKKSMVIEEVDEEVFLPDGYLERFSTYPVENQAQLKGRDDELKNLKIAYENWKINNAPLLVVSDFGEGSSSLMYSSISLYENVKIIENKSAIHSQEKLLKILKGVFELEGDYKNISALKEDLFAQEKNYVIVFENIERMFLREIGGFKLIEEFLLFVHRTKLRVYWVITVKKYSNYFLSNVKLFSSNFSSILRLGPISNEVLIEELVSRNEGYKLVYLKPTRLTKKLNKSLKKAAPELRQELLKAEYDRLLTLYAKGNISRAIHFSKLSAIRVKDDTVFLKPYQQKVIPTLSLNEMFLIEALLQHSRLTIVEFNNILRNTKRETRLAIEKLLEQQLILVYRENSGRVEYGINIIYLTPLKTLMQDRLNRKYVI